MANIRTAYAEVTAAYLSDSKAHSVDVTLVQTKNGWQSGGTIAGVKLGEKASTDTITATAKGTITVEISTEGVVKIGSVEVKGDAVTTNS